MKIFFRLLFTIEIALLSYGTFAAETPLADPVLEARARALMAEVRCVVCQSQSIAESDAEIAADMRRLIRDQIVAGKSDEDILQYLSSRYGDFVRFRPPFKESTWGLWIGPFAVLFIALGAGGLFYRRLRILRLPNELSMEERSKLDRILKDGLNRPDNEVL